MESKKVGGCYDQPKEKGFQALSIFTLRGTQDLPGFSVPDSFAGRNVLEGFEIQAHLATKGI